VGTASRTEAKNIWQVISGLEAQSHQYDLELDKLKKANERLETKMKKVREKLRILMVKNVELGTDAEGNKYWFFTQDSSRVYVYLYQSGSY